MVRRKHFIGMMLMGLLAVAACTSIETPEPVEGSSPELCAIDSLMWLQPDSALAVLLEYDGNTDGFNGHYAQLLASELLYKNDYEQTNRPELQRAVGYFDSLLVADTRHASTKTTAFLAARAHYINGVGYYERDSVVEACKEYLNALEIMENHFEAKELVGHKARFMAYTYNRLGDMFAEQFMMEPSIDCYKKALVYCKIEPTSPQGVSNILSRIGLQYDKLGDKEKMRDYYSQAQEAMPNPENLSYRDLSSGIALSNYQLGYGINQSLEVLKQIVVKAEDESERLTRYLTIGAIFTEEGMYDSAVFYLESVLENEKDLVSQIQAAEYLRIIYDSIGDNEKLHQCLHFLALQKKPESQNKALVSQLEELFKTYMNQKLEQKALQEKKEAVSKTVKIVVPVIVFVCVCIIFIIKRRNKRRMKVEIVTLRMQQAALSGKLKKSNEALRDTSKQLEKAMAEKAAFEQRASVKDYSSFRGSLICRQILETVENQYIKSKMDCSVYKEYALSKEQLQSLRDSADEYMAQFTTRIRNQFPKLTDEDMNYCCLYMLGLNDAEVSALMQRAYPTVCERNRKIRRIIGETNNLSFALRNL